MTTDTVNTRTDKYAGRTPGPWVCTFTVQSVRLDDGRKWGTFRVRQRGEGARHDYAPTHTATDAANARLIADAPTLLAQRDELAGLLARVDDLFDNDADVAEVGGEPVKNLHADIRAALAKIGGTDAA